MDAGPRFDAGLENMDAGQLDSGTMDAGCTTEDEPDPALVDSNCDGIDGDLQRAVFVSPTGNDARRGGSDAPVATITRALEIARSERKTQVLIASGVYQEPNPVELVEGVGLYGGYKAGSWSRGRGTTVIEGAATAVLAQDLQNRTTLARVELRAADAVEPGTASIGLIAVNAPGLSIVDGSTISAGLGGAGIDGAEGARGADGNDGGPGGNGDGNDQADPGAGGRGGDNPACAIANGGTGGRGGRNDSFRGIDGQVSPSGTPGGPGGVTDNCDPDDGQPGNPALPSDDGANGPAGTAQGSFDSQGQYTPSNGRPGAPGAHGAGGGGGGGSSGQTGFSCIDGAGNGGGGGGAGGCGGGFGEAGSGGGASVGMLIVGAVIEMDGIFITTVGGGKGGAGGDGAEGGTPGMGGPGASRDLGELARAGDGGDGAAGGHGGHGGGGGGGPSIGLWTNAYSAVPPNVGFRLGPEGPGGESSGNPGESGTRIELWTQDDL